MAINSLVITRILIGCLFVFSGFEKLIGPHQNFLYVVQSYKMFGVFLENIVAHVSPWIELFLGVFLLLGLWLKWVLRALRVLIAMFILVVAQAAIRNIPITECGCFGQLVSFPLYLILVFDGALLVLAGLLSRKEADTRVFSLDCYFDK